MKIYLIRHGESVSDVKQRYEGNYDDPLTKKGEAEAKEIAQKLLNKGVEMIFSSTRLRAAETANIIQAMLNCPITPTEKLNEQDIYSAYPRLAVDQPEEEYRRLGELIADRDAIVPNAETYQSVRKRVAECFFEILKSPYRIVVIITHGGPMRSIVRDILGRGELKDMTNGAIIELQGIDSHLSILSVNGVSLCKSNS